MANYLRTFIGFYLLILAGMVVLFFAFIPIDNIPIVNFFLDYSDSPLMLLSQQLPVFVFLTPIVFLAFLLVSIVNWRK